MIYNVDAIDHIRPSPDNILAKSSIITFKIIESKRKKRETVPVSCFVHKKTENFLLKEKMVRNVFLFEDFFQPKYIIQVNVGHALAIHLNF